ncbi:MAG: MFS transporter [Sphingomonas fennica]
MTMPAATAPAAAPRSPARYQIVLIAVLSLNFGIVFFDRNALNFLMPFVQPDLGLSNLQVGLLASMLSFTWALAAFAVGRVSDRLGRRKPVILVCTLLFSLCSVVSGLAGSFIALLAARLLMGVAEGGILPISQSLAAAEVSPERRGLAMGVTQNFGSNLIGTTVAAVVLVQVAAAYGWRESFYLSAVPGLISAALIWWLVKEPAPGEAVAGAPAEKMSLGQAFALRNVWLCSLIAVLLVAYLVICWAFMPLFLTRVRGFAPETMGWLMGTLGVSAAVGSFLVPGLSDRIGRKPIMIAVPLLGVILPLGAMYFDGSTWALAAIFFFGWALNGCFPMFMATIPSETVDARHTATAMGLVMGVGELVGGVASPPLAGWAADRVGLAAPLWIMFGLCIAAGLLALLLVETAPRRRR